MSKRPFKQFKDYGEIDAGAGGWTTPPNPDPAARPGGAGASNLPTYEELRAALASVCRKYAACADALDYADSEGFQWPVDPLSDMALAFADPTRIPEYALLVRAEQVSA